MMKQFRNTMMLLMALLLVSACGGNKGTKSAEAQAEGESATAQTSETPKDGFSKEAAGYYFGQMGVSLDEMKPSYEFDESDKFTYFGEKLLTSAQAQFKKASGELSKEEMVAEVKRIYALTEKASENGKNVWGYDDIASPRKTKEEASEQKSLEEVLKAGDFYDMYEWSFIRDGLFYRCNVNKVKDPNDSDIKIGFIVKMHKGLQENMDATVKKAEEGLDKIENDPELKKKVQDAVDAEVNKALGK